MSYNPIICDFYRFAAELPPIYTDEALGERLVDYADHCYFEGMPGAYGKKLKAALADDRPRYGRTGAGKLPRFSRALQAWNRLDPGRTRPRMPWNHLVLLTLDLLHDNLRVECVFFFMTFVCYFRPGESLAILAGDILPASPPTH